MAYTTRQIQTIHQQGSARYRKKYVDLNGDVYVGQRNGRLEKEDPRVAILQRQVNALETTVIEEVTTEEDVAVAIASYFEYDTVSGGYQPIEVISEIIVNNIFTIDLLAGGLTPATELTNTDIYFEFDGEGCIIPKEI